MRTFSLFGAIVVSLLSAAPSSAATITIDVAEVTWRVEGETCVVDVVEDCLAIFTLNYLWVDPSNSGPGPAIGGAIDIGDATSLTFFDTFVPITQDSTSLIVFSNPDLAQATLYLFFDPLNPFVLGPSSDWSGEFFESDAPSPAGRSLFFQHVVQIEDPPTPVPEPASFALLGLGLLAARRRLRAR